MAHVKDVLADQLLANANDLVGIFRFQMQLRVYLRGKLSGNRMKRVTV